MVLSRCECCVHDDNTGTVCHVPAANGSGVSSEWPCLQSCSCSACQFSISACLPLQQLRSHFGAWCIEQLAVPSLGWAFVKGQGGGREHEGSGRSPSAQPWKHGTQSMSDARRRAKWLNNVWEKALHSRRSSQIYSWPRIRFKLTLHASDHCVMHAMKKAAHDRSHMQHVLEAECCVARSLQLHLFQLKHWG